MSLIVPASSGFGKFADNYGSTFTEAGLGTSITSHATNANTKNATPTQLIAGASVTDDVYGISIRFQSGFQSGEARRFMTDIYIDPAGGTSWEASPRIANLLTNCVAMTMGGTEYFFPLYIPKGASIGAACQAQLANLSVRVAVRVYMAPDLPWAQFCGRRVKTFGATTASTTGTAFTPGASGAKGSYSASLGTTADELWWWQMGICFNDASQTAVQYSCDMAFGDASNKYLAILDAWHCNIGTVEAAAFPKCGGSGLPWRRAPSGSLIYVRGACTGTADSNASAVVYGVGD